MIREIMTKVIDLSKRIKIRGITHAATMDPSDMKSHKYTVNTKNATATNKGKGHKAR